MISIIICSIDPEKFRNVAANYTALIGSEPFEIIGIHDAKSLCEGYNRGIKQSIGEILIFSHDDIEILTPDFVTRLQNHLNNFDIVGLAGTNRVMDGNWIRAGMPNIYGMVGHPHDGEYLVYCYDLCAAGHHGRIATGGIKMLDGLFFAARRSVMRKIIFDEEIFDGFHCYDADFTYSAYLAGFSLGVCNDIAVIHASGGRFDGVFKMYNRRFIEKHATTLVAYDPKATKPTLQYARCSNKHAVLSCFSPEAQKKVYGHLAPLFPNIASALESTTQTAMKQTPIHDQHNPDLLNLIPLEAKRVIEVGCSSGALAKAYRQANPNCEYWGTEIDPSYAEIARQHCNQVIIGNIEQMLEEIQTTQEAFDCWIFGDVLEHLYDPWRLLKRIAQDLLTPSGSVVACIPNMQHWQMQFALNVGNLRYQDSGLLDRTHIRWFTRITIIEMFQQAGLQIDHIEGRAFNEPQREIFMPLLRDLAEASGGDPDQAVADATPLQWVVHATLPCP
jgi:2-polyprenyl-3-methyl-5-hydroxy-6-metoxy-1,4-benzoquinol methylase